MKVEVNENLTSIINHIQDTETVIDFDELLQFCIDYRMYKELYIHLPIIKEVIKQHNQKINAGTWVKAR